MAWLSRCKVVAVKVLARPHIFLPLLSVALVFYLHQQVPALFFKTRSSFFFLSWGMPALPWQQHEWKLWKLQKLFLMSLPAFDPKG